jgi:hypothetical protein
MTAKLEFFFYGSIHTYLSVMRIDGFSEAVIAWIAASEETMH